MDYWLVKSEPEAYSWAQFVKDGQTAWTGGRNFAARNDLRAMKKATSFSTTTAARRNRWWGLARVIREAYPDPTANAGNWYCVDFAPVKPLAKPISLIAIKADEVLREIVFVKQSRLSVSPMLKSQFEGMLRLAGMRV